LNAPQQPGPGWYPDPSGPGRRYWDGRQWTEHTQPAPPPPAQPYAAPVGASPFGGGAAPTPAPGSGSRTAVLAVLVAVAAVAVVVGALFAFGVIGGGDDAGGGASDRLSLAEYKAEYQQIDDEARQVGGDVSSTLQGANSASSDEDYAAQIAPLVDRVKQISVKLESLAPKAPSKDVESSTKIEAYEASKLAEALDAMRAAVARHDSAGAKSATAEVIRRARATQLTADTVRTKVGLPASGAN
jgi:hypothetical protein